MSFLIPRLGSAEFGDRRIEIQGKDYKLKARGKTYVIITKTGKRTSVGWEEMEDEEKFFFVWLDLQCCQQPYSIASNSRIADEF
jgi:hypothetical protein